MNARRLPLPYRLAHFFDRRRGHADGTYFGRKHRYSFAVIAGINAGEPLSTRAARMKNYNELVRELDSGGAHYSQELSEVDLSDPEGRESAGCRCQRRSAGASRLGELFATLQNLCDACAAVAAAVREARIGGLRYDGQIIVNPDLNGMASAAGFDTSGGQGGDGRGSENRGDCELREICNASGGGGSGEEGREAQGQSRNEGRSSSCSG